MRIRFAGKGEPGSLGGPPGDLFFVLDVQPHDLFEREGNDVLCQVEVGVAQAALGADVEVPTLTGTKALTVPSGTQHGDVLRFKGEGIPRLRGGARGDQVMQILVRVPEKLTKRQRELLEEFAQIEGDQVRRGRGGFRSFVDKLTS
jgi:molecular chaperone DnaJ